VVPAARVAVRVDAARVAAAAARVVEPQTLPQLVERLRRRAGPLRRTLLLPVEPLRRRAEPRRTRLLLPAGHRTAPECTTLPRHHRRRRPVLDHAVLVGPAALRPTLRRAQHHRHRRPLPDPVGLRDDDNDNNAALKVGAVPVVVPVAGPAMSLLRVDVVRVAGPAMSLLRAVA
jgi:hypothetical protein